MKTFIESVKSGESSISDIDQWIDCWHTATDATIGSLSLSEYLGFSPQEYQEFLHDPGVVDRIVKGNAGTARPGV